MTVTDAANPSKAGPGPELDPGAVEQRAGQLFGILTGALLSSMIDIGHRTGLFTAIAQGPATVEELAARAGLQERYVREWVGAVVTGGLLDFDPATELVSIAPELAVCLTDGPMNMAPYAQLNTHLGKQVHKVARAFREGGGVPYSEYRPEFTDLMDEISRTIYDSALVDAYLPIVPGLTEQLESGVRVADVCCGTGHALVVLARRFPASAFVGYDLDEGAIGRARAEAAGAGLSNVTFHAADAARLTATGGDRFDVVFVFDAIHDQVDPRAVLAHIRDALVPGGTLLIKEPRAGDSLEENRQLPFAPVLYSISTLHCMTVSLAHDGAGIGTAFGSTMARQLLTDAGFEHVEMHDAPGDPMDAIYVARTPEGAR
jgi:SAM-dependent methyltransferase